MGSFTNPKIQLDPRLWAIPKTIGSQSPAENQSSIESLQLQILARVSALLKDPDLKLPEIQSASQVLRADCGKKKHALSKICGVASEGVSSTSLPLPVRWLHVRSQTAHGTLLTLAITLNATLLMRSPSNHSLVEEPAILKYVKRRTDSHVFIVTFSNWKFSETSPGCKS
ncbi:hypothetical protein VE03_04894 [Pseudogymnoascus sp. 23342-1-I1]|nr:hypothetical protein VE03_04894 [Pseudogymnoascus sp. 23342-1-I1]